MTDFSLKIQTAEGIAVFYFTRIFTIKGPIYFVTMKRKGASHYFHVEKRDEQWKIVLAPKPPDWVFEYEEQLSDTIEKHHAK